MIACISPSDVYIEETMSTLNYATRTMNIKNKPILQMDPKDQIIFNSRREIQLLKMENAYLKEKLYLKLILIEIRINAGIPIDLPITTVNSMHASGFSLPPINNRPAPAQQQNMPIPLSSKSTSKGTPNSHPTPPAVIRNDNQAKKV